MAKLDYSTSTAFYQILLAKLEPANVRAVKLKIPAVISSVLARAVHRNL